MLAIVVLGNRMNDDGTMTELAEKRVQAAVRLDKAMNAKFIVLSGGIANEKAGVSEAAAMAKRMIVLGVPQQKLVLEDKSTSTKENALFAVPLAAKLGVTELIVVTSNEHMSRSFLNPIELFCCAAEKYPTISVRAYSE